MSRMRLMVCLAVAGATLAGLGEVRLAAPFADGMVLQRERPVPVWGTATPGAKVAVRFAGQRVETTAGTNGEWRVRLAPLATSRAPQTLEVTGDGAGRKVNDVLVGEVWFASGQSNMGFTLTEKGPMHDRAGVLTAQITRLKHVRYARIDAPPSVRPVKTLKPLVWKKFLPENLTPSWSISAVAFYYARELALALGDVPVGIVVSAVGGTCVDTWTPACGFATRPELADLARWRYVEKKEDWAARRNYCPFNGWEQQPSLYWNGRLEAVAPYAMRGFIWYQGCHNANEPERYAAKMHALYDGWAKKFENPGLKCYFVQLPFWGRSDTHLIQEAQAKFAAEQPNAGMAVIADRGNVRDIHPDDKEPVARRLALHALAKDYGFPGVVCESPVLRSWTVDGAKARLVFDHATSFYLRNDDRSEATCFDLAGADGVFKPARIANFALRRDARTGKDVSTGRIDGNAIELVADGVAAPLHVRYLYRHPWTAGLYSQADLPLGAFHADKAEFPQVISAWRGETFAWRRAVTNRADGTMRGPQLACPKGVKALTGLLEEVPYAVKPLPYGKTAASNREMSAAPDYPVWGGERAVKAGEVTWQVAEVTVAPDAAPGSYDLGPFTLRIVERVLPPAKDWKYHLDLWQHPWAVARYHGVKPFSPEHYAKMKPLWERLAASGQKVLTATLVDLPWNHQCYDGYEALPRVERRKDGSWGYDFAEFNAYVKFGKACGIGPDLALYTMCPWGYKVSWYEDGARRQAEAKPGTPFFEEYWGSYLPALAANLKANGWFEQTYIAMDERTPEDLRNIGLFLGKLGLGFKTSTAGNKPPSAYKGLTIDCYSQILSSVTDAFLDEVPERRQAGRKTTFYVCCGPQRPNTFMSSTAGEAFWCGFYPAACGLDGFLRWAYNSWPQDPRRDASYGHWASGDTFFVYPGDVPSWRFLELSDGIRQAEKWRILKEAGQLPRVNARLEWRFALGEALQGTADYAGLAERVRAYLAP